MIPLLLCFLYLFCVRLVFGSFFAVVFLRYMFMDSSESMATGGNIVAAPTAFFNHCTRGLGRCANFGW